MSYDNDMQNPMYELFRRMMKDFAGDDNPGIPMHPVFLRYFLESQKLFLKWYLEYIDDQSSQDSVEERMKKMTKAFMASYMDFMKAHRENRDRLLRTHSDLLKDYVGMLDDMLHQMPRRER